MPVRGRTGRGWWARATTTRAAAVLVARAVGAVAGADMVSAVVLCGGAWPEGAIATGRGAPQTASTHATYHGLRISCSCRLLLRERGEHVYACPRAQVPYVAGQHSHDFQWASENAIFSVALSVPVWLALGLGVLAASRENRSTKQA